MHVLILGGTRFAGRAVTDAALDRGDTVTLFNRGETNPGLYPQAETIIGDRTGDLTALSTRHRDAVVDVAAYDPEVVRRSAQALAGVGTGSPDAVLQWVPSARLLAAGVEPWMGVPLWVAAPGWEPGKEGLSREREEDLLQLLAGPR